MATSVGFPWTGGKSDLAEPLAKIIEYCAHEHKSKIFADLCCGGGKITCAVSSYPFEQVIMNDLELGVANLYACLTDKGQTKELMSLVAKLIKRKDLDVLFEEANELRNKQNTIRLLSAAYTLISIYGSRHSGKKTYESNAFATNFHLGKVHQDLDIKYNKILKNVKVLNEDCLSWIRNNGSCEDILVYLDPPYVEGVMVSKDHYENGMTDLQHEMLAKMLQDSNMKWILSGWENPIYAHYLENKGTCKRYYIGTINLYSGSVEDEVVGTHDEYIWTNMALPSKLIPKKKKVLEGAEKSETKTEVYEPVNKSLETENDKDTPTEEQD